MINLLLTIVASALFSFYFIEMARLHKKWKIDFRPFNCLVCLPAWIALALYWLPSYITEILIVMMGAAILSVLINTLMRKANETGAY
jgi:hypothetical protein